MTDDEFSPKVRSEDRPRIRAKRDWARLTVALTLATILGAVLVSTYVIEEMQVCRDKLSESGETVRICEPAGPADLLTVGVVVALIIILVWDEISEFAIPGFFSLKRRVDEVERGVNYAINQIGMSQQNILHVWPPPNFEPLNKLSEEMASSAPSASQETVGVRKITDKCAKFELDIIQTWNIIEKWLRPLLYGQNRRQRFGEELESSPEWASRWLATFQEELDEFRNLRNLVVHQPTRVSDDDIEVGWRAAKSLLASQSLAMQGEWDLIASIKHDAHRIRWNDGEKPVRGLWGASEVGILERAELSN